MRSCLVIFAGILLALSASIGGAQSPQCMTPDEAKKAAAAITNGPPVPENKKLRKEILDMREKQLALDSEIAYKLDKSAELMPRSAELGDRNFFRVCQIVREIGWPSKETIKEDAVAALTSIIQSGRSRPAQRELIPVLTAAADKGYISKALIAVVVDQIRVAAGAAQIFGTQAVVREDVIYLYPLIDESKVESWRKQYDLQPLQEQMRSLEDRYALPVLRTHLPKKPAKRSGRDADLATLGIDDSEEQPVKVETHIVSLNVRILDHELKPPATALDLTKDDFVIMEDGVEQQATFFSTADKPFDLVLILDFSGSTSEKRGLIKKAAQRFVQFTRAQDRIAIIAFADEIKMVSDLTEDKAALAVKIKNIEMDGTSPVWSSMGFAYKNILDKESVGRRSAIVIMSDGLDNSKDTTFSDLLETARHHETTVYPVYLDIDKGNGEFFERFRRRAQLSLSMLAEDTGGQIHKVDNLKDLNGIYEQIVNDLGKVLSLGYEPKNDVRDGTWRSISVKLRSKPDLVAKTRRGYYAD